MGAERTLTVGSVRIACQVSGHPDLPPMIMLHALGQRAAAWAPVTDVFAERFHVYAPDLRGHGDSDWPGAYSFQLMRDDVLGLLDQLAVGPVTLVGHSMGGVIAYLIASQQPRRVTRLIIEDAPVPYRRDRPIPIRPPDSELDFDWEVVPAIVSQVNAGDPQAWKGLSAITAPTLIIGGGTESSMPQDRLADVAVRIPHCDLVTIPAGHHVHETRPVEFADAVLRWIGPTWSR